MATQDRHPDADGIRSNWTPNNGGDDYVEVDEVGAHDSDTSYLYRDDSGSNFTVEIPPFNITSSSVTKITITTVTRVAGAYFVYHRAQIVVSGTVYNSAISGPANSQSYVENSADFLTNPKTTNAWTEAEVEQTDGVNDLQEIGIESIGHTGGEQIRCTKIHAIVTYVAPAAGARPQGPLGHVFTGPFSGPI